MVPNVGVLVASSLDDRRGGVEAILADELGQGGGEKPSSDHQQFQIKGEINGGRDQSLIPYALDNGNVASTAELPTCPPPRFSALGSADPPCCIRLGLSAG